MSVSTVSVEQITRKRKRGWLPGWLVWSMLIVATGVTGLWYYQSRTLIAAVPHYITQKATKGSITVAVSAVGTVEPIDQVDVSSEISGIVREIKVAINDNVKTGQVMASLDTSALAAELARDKATLSSSKAGVEDVQATLDEATQTLTRMQTMMDRGVATQETLTTAQTVKRRADAALASAKANVEVAQADLQVSQANLDKAFIYAPMDGVILARGISVGQTVSASTTPTIMFTLAHDLGQMKLQVDVDEADIGKVSAGDPATFTVEAHQGQSFPAKVTELHFAPQTVDGIVTYQTILAIDNQAHLLRPGMTASADITVDQVTDKLIVPNAAFRYSPPIVAAERKSSGLLGMLFSGPPDRQRTSTTNSVTNEGYRNLWVLKAGEATRVSVKTGVTDGDHTEILDGPLSEGDTVITAAAPAR